MKLVKVLKKHKKWVLRILVAAATFALVAVLHEVGTAERGFEAVGGEVMVFLLPFIIHGLVQSAKETVEELKK